MDWVPQDELLRRVFRVILQGNAEQGEALAVALVTAAKIATGGLDPAQGVGEAVDRGLRGEHLQMVVKEAGKATSREGRKLLWARVYAHTGQMLGGTYRSVSAALGAVGKTQLRDSVAAYARSDLVR